MVTSAAIRNGGNEEADQWKRRKVMQVSSKITPCLWFDTQAEEAARFYAGIFPNSRIETITRHGEVGHEVPGRSPESVLMVEFRLDGQTFTALNAGPEFTFNEAISLQIMCDTQEEVDHYWEKLSEGGDEKAQQCGWLKDRYGVSWQVVPRALLDMLKDAPGGDGAKRAFKAMLEMKKMDIPELQRAYAG
jgi:predicted 3-demethylubiquinone-9 3-methyltransferase (glyoxalase superfamily)